MEAQRGKYLVHWYRAELGFEPGHRASEACALSPCTQARPTKIALFCGAEGLWGA